MLDRDWTYLLIPDRPPTHTILGGGFLLFRLLELAALIALIARPGTAAALALAAAAAISIIVNTVRWRTQHSTRVADIHRWRVLRKILRGDLLTAVGDQAPQLNIDERAAFTEGVRAVEEHIQVVAHIENEQAREEIGWL